MATTRASVRSVMVLRASTSAERITNCVASTSPASQALDSGGRW